MTAQQTWLLSMAAAATAAKHIWPAYAACEAALESGFGATYLARTANNLFGQKAPAKLGQGQQITTVPEDQLSPIGRFRGTASYLKFASAEECFAARMATLKGLPMYYQATTAKTGEDFIMQVSAVWTAVAGPADPAEYIYAFDGGSYKFKGNRWGRYPARASDVLAIYTTNAALFAHP